MLQHQDGAVKAFFPGQRPERCRLARARSPHQEEEVDRGQALPHFVQQGGAIQVSAPHRQPDVLQGPLTFTADPLQVGEQVPLHAQHEP